MLGTPQEALGPRSNQEGPTEAQIARSLFRFSRGLVPLMGWPAKGYNQVGPCHECDVPGDGVEPKHGRLALQGVARVVSALSCLIIKQRITVG